MSENTESESPLQFRDPGEKTARKKYDIEQQKPDKGDWLSVCEKSEKRLREEELLRQVLKNKNQINNDRKGTKGNCPKID